jgi:putative membrane protein
MNEPAARRRGDYFLSIALGCYLLLWIALAIHPVDRRDWFLENLLVFVTVGVLVPTHRRFQFSNLSYGLILIFLTVHAVGAHYTYAKVPAGFWLQDWFGFSRNHNDRVIHFSFGVLIFYPMRELLRRSARAQEPWATWLAVFALAALCSFFEVVEGIVVQIVHPEIGTAYLGMQGDIWDAQKDMGVAFLGAIITALGLLLLSAPQSAGESR